jgi:hypothetical protein
MLLCTIQDKGCLTLFDSEELVDTGMNLIAYFLTRLQAHHHELGILTGE